LQYQDAPLVTQRGIFYGPVQLDEDIMATESTEEHGKIKTSKK